MHDFNRKEWKDHAITSAPLLLRTFAEATLKDRVSSHVRFVALNIFFKKMYLAIL